MTGDVAVVAVVPEVDAQRRFGALERLYGVRGAAHIRAAHVAVVGLGGVGSWAAEALARSGVGHLTLVDLDHIAESNINRQIHALGAPLAKPKCKPCASALPRSIQPAKCGALKNLSMPTIGWRWCRLACKL